MKKKLSLTYKPFHLFAEPIILLVTIIVVLTSITSCKKDGVITSADARLIIYADTIKFDTVFTSVGSVTRSFKIVNDNDQQLILTRVKLMGGINSPFRINVNGINSSEVWGTRIEANDSIYVFVSVTVNPTAVNLPFILSDSIVVEYNGNTRFVQLQAYGQNARFLRNHVITGNHTWTNELPYVLLGGLRVDTSATLIIEAGTRIYAHADAPFIVDGSLIINGTRSARVVFTGDRLDEPYKNFPASWPGIYFRGSSKDNQMKFVVIKNAYQGLVISDPASNSNPKLILQQTIIDNAYDAGISCFNTSVQASNVLVSNCNNNIHIQAGGQYVFTHCTVASYSNDYLWHRTPVMTATNFSNINGFLLTAPMNALFSNCIFWGENGIVENEVVIGKQGNDPFMITMDHCLYKALNEPSNTVLVTSIRNQDPVFDSVDAENRYFDFRTSKNSLAPGINKGTLTAFTKDLDDNNRNVGIPDLGCYEKQ